MNEYVYEYTFDNSMTIYTYSNSTYRNTFSFQSKNGMYKYIREVTNGVVIWIYDSENIKNIEYFIFNCVFLKIFKKVKR